LNPQKRGALLPYSIWLLNKRDPSIQEASDVYQFLLIDVEMGGCATTSQTVQAIGSVQLYMQRCRLMLEPGGTRVPIPAVWWEWMTSYRVWEANRKVFLFPENYLDPTLRRGATPLFDDLKDQLLQTNVTDATIERAYRGYFDGFTELATLNYCESFLCPVK